MIFFISSSSDTKNRAMTPEGATGASTGTAPQKKTSVEEKEVEEKRRISQVRLSNQRSAAEAKRALF